MKYVFPFLLNGGLVLVALLWVRTTSVGLAALGILFIMLLLGAVLNVLLAVIQLMRRETVVGMLYGAFLLGAVLLFVALQKGTHGKLVNG